MQLIAITIWYNETKLTKAFDEMAAAGKINRLNNSLITAQGFFNAYINNGEVNSLNLYSNSLNRIDEIIDSLEVKGTDDLAKASLLQKKKKTQHGIRHVKAAIDSIINRQAQNEKDFPKAFKFKEFETKKFLDDVKTDSYVKMDSVSRKGLFSRIGDAINNKVEVQKQYVNTVVTMRYKDKIKTGTLEEQLANVISISNEYYVDEFSKLKKSYTNLRNNDLKLMELNNELFALNQSLTADFTKANPLLKPDNQHRLQDEYGTRKTVRSVTIVLLILLMLVISVILFNFTRLAFEYEKQLTLAQEKIRQNLNFKNRITGMISHEIRSPLSIISMYSKKAGAAAKEPELQETFKSIEFTTNSLLLLSNQILEYSKEENGKLALKGKNMQLKPEIHQILSSLKSVVETKGNTLEIKSNLKDGLQVYSDAGKIYQLFYNLIGNANKFTEKGKITVDVKLEQISDYEMNLKVIIADNGMGIAENDLKNIFESYYQGTVSEKVNDLGVGLGLNICKEIVELFDGDISIESKPGVGTKVLFNLMLTQV